MVKQGLHLFALGGLDRCGQRNMTVYDCDGDLIAVDCGFGFPDAYFPGADLTVPDVSYLATHKDRLKAIFITHRHEDHMGALPWVWADIPVPVYCTSFVAGMLEQKMGRLGFDLLAKINIMQPGKDNAVSIGKFRVEMVHVTHSTPQSTSLAIHSPYGTVLHSGDYRLDDHPRYEPPSDETRLKELGDAGLLALLGDATGALSTKPLASEQSVEDSLANIIASRKGRRVFVTTFSTHVYRLRGLLQIAKDQGRKVTAVGSAIQTSLKVANKVGLLPDDLYRIVVPVEQIHKVNQSNTLVLIGGCQADPRSSLVRLSHDESSDFKISPHDTVILSSSWVPGNEPPVWQMVSNLVEQGAEVLHVKKGDFVHVSGHGTIPDITKYLTLTRPQLLIPVHGDFLQLQGHIDIAKQLGIPQTLLLKNGEVLQLYPHIKLTGALVPHGMVAIEEKRLIEPAEQYIYKERRKMAETGIVFVVLPVSKTGQYLAGPLEMTTHGVLGEVIWAESLKAIRQDLQKFVAKLAPQGKIKNLEQLTEAVRQGTRRGFMAEIGRKPTTIVSVITVSGGQG